MARITLKCAIKVQRRLPPIYVSKKYIKEKRIAFNILLYLVKLKIHTCRHILSPFHSEKYKIYHKFPIMSVVSRPICKILPSILLTFFKSFAVIPIHLLKVLTTQYIRIYIHNYVDYLYPQTFTSQSQDITYITL